MERISKQERQHLLLELLEREPFLTDVELARRLQVSVATIRLDRLSLAIPEVRERTRHLAKKAAATVVSMHSDEVVGELIDLELGRWAVSILQTKQGMGFSETGIVRGHHLFAQANSLAVAVIDASAALTAGAQLRFLHPVRTGESVIAKAVVRTDQAQRKLVVVTSTVNHTTVFKGRFIIWTGHLNQLTTSESSMEAKR